MPSTSYAPSEAAIEAAIAARIGNPGFFQRVAEQLARGFYVELAHGLVPFGRRPDDKTVRGWPDAFLTEADGTIIAVEATTAADAKTKHWTADLAKLEAQLPSRRRRGLIWVAWCDTTGPTEAAEMREQACRLGLRGSDVHIVFRKDLCARLRAPIHARFWINDLGLSVTHGPFRRIHDVVRETGYRSTASIFPTAEEYEQNRVYAPPALADVDRALAEQRAAMVVGHGAAGKTTLAMILAHQPRFKHAATYYLDLTAASDDPTLTERAGEAFSAFGDRGVLFVVDNAHLDPGAAVRVFEQWESFGGGSELLILTRRVRGTTKPWDNDPELESMPLPRIDLTIEPGDLEGVYQRLCRARGAEPAVTPDVVDGWHRLFGGDLLSFSAAVLGLLDRSGEPADLEAVDARSYVRRRYLADPDLIPERSALLDLAAVAEIEGLVPVEAFDEDALRTCARQGLVWIEARGLNGMHRRYRLAHPGLGTLLREAAGLTGKSREDRCRVLESFPYACIATSLKVRNVGNTREAGGLLSALWRKTDWPLAEIGFGWWRNTIAATIEMNLLTAEEIQDRFNSWLVQAGHSQLVEMALATSLNNLRAFLNYAQAEMPEAATVIRDGLANHPERLVKQALAMPLGHLASFLAYAQAEMPEVATVIRDGLANDPEALIQQVLGMPLSHLASFLAYAQAEMPEVATVIRDGLANNPEMLVKQALVTPLSHLASFLAYAQAEMPEVATVIRDGLANDPERLVKQALVTPLEHLASFLAHAQAEMPEVATVIRDGLANNPERLVKQALVTPLEHLASFLAYAQAEMPEAATVIRDGLANNPERLVKQALVTPLEHLASFLAYAQADMPEVATVIRDGLADNPVVLVKRALVTQFEHLASFLAYAQAEMPQVAATVRDALMSEPAMSVLAKRSVPCGPRSILALCKTDETFIRLLPAIDAGDWSRHWGMTHHRQPTWFRGFASLCYRTDRPDLLGITAEAIIQTAHPDDFPSNLVTIIHLSFILTSPHGCTAEQVGEFFARRLPRGWVAGQYNSPSATTGAIAGATRAIAADDRRWLAPHFRDPALWRRLEAGQPAERQFPRRVAEWLQLLSAARLLDRTVPSLRTADAGLLSEAAGVVPPGPADQGIQPMQAGLWAGLREWCHLTGQRPIVDAALGDGILAQFRAANLVDRPRLAAINAVMIDWLERCRTRDWRLIADQGSLLDAVERQLGDENPSG